MVESGVVAHRKRRGDLVRQQGQRKVPWDDRAHHAQGPANHEPEGAGHGQRNLVAPDGSGGGQGCVELDVLYKTLGLDLRIAQRFSLFASEQEGHLVQVLPG